MHPFLQQIWQRPILRTAAAYVVLAWLVVQVASVLLPAFDLPDTMMRLIILLSILGLPAVLITAWAMSVREGTRLTETPGGTAVDLLVIALVCVAAAIAAREVPQTLDLEATEASLSRPIGLPRAKLEANSLAVLPFAALSDAQEDGYFADGLTEDLLNTLARIPGLRVVGRTSVFYYKGRNEDLRTIAAQLNVRYVIEGSVRRDGDRLRISIQLIEADSGFNLWSETFDRLNENILEIQRTIAQKVANVLQVRLIGENERSLAEVRPGPGRVGPLAAPKPPVVDLGDVARQADLAAATSKARRLFLIGLARLRRRGPSNIEAAVVLFEQALEIDPANAETLAHLASAQLLLSGFKSSGATDYSPAAAEARASDLIDRALKADPECATAYAVRGLLFMQRALAIAPGEAGRDDLAAQATRDLQKAIALDPRNVEALLWHGVVLRELDDDALAAQALFDAALEIDPLYQRGLQNSAMTLTDLGRFDEARATLRQLLKLYPDSAEGLFAVANFESTLGREDTAIRYTLAGLEKDFRPAYLVGLAEAYESLGDIETATRLLRTATGYDNVREIALLSLYYMTGAFDEAIALVEREPAALAMVPIGVLRAAIAVRRGQPEEALAILRTEHPYYFEDDPEDLVSGKNGTFVALAAYALRRTGERTRSARLLEALERRYTPEPHLFDKLCTKMARSAVQAIQGRTERALDTLESAVDQGLVRLDNSLCGMLPAPLEDHPYFASVRNTRRFQALLDRVRQRAAAQLERVASEPLPSPSGATGPGREL